MGTRFIATKEAPAHDNVKQALVAASELQTCLIMRPSHNTERVLANATVEKILTDNRLHCRRDGIHCRCLAAGIVLVICTVAYMFILARLEPIADPPPA